MINVGDPHLGDVTDCIEIDGIPSKVSDTLARLSELVDIAANWKESLVLMGDVWDTSAPKPFVIEGLFRIFKKAWQLGVKIYIIPGNHDCDVRWSNLVIAEHSNYDNVICITAPTLLEVDGQAVLFVPHIPKRYEDSILQGRSYEQMIAEMVKKSKHKVICITHAQIYGSSVTAGTEREMEAGTAITLDIGKLPALRALFAGHVHQAQHFMHIRYKFPIAYSGSLVPHNFGEGDDATVGKSFIHSTPDLVYDAVDYETAIQEYKTIKLNALNGPIQITDAVRKKVATLQDKLLKLVIHCNSRDEVNETEIKELFDETSHVLRIEYVIHRDETKHHISAETAILDNLDHAQLLEDYLDEDESDASTKQMALEIGREIIASCLTK